MSFSRPLHAAVDKKDNRLLANLLSVPAVIDDFERSYTPLLLAIQKDNYIAVNLLLDNGADLARGINEESNSIHFCIDMRNWSILDLLMNHATKSVINKKDSIGQTPFHKLAAGLYEGITILLNYPRKLEFYHLTNDGLTVMDLAMRSSDLDIAQLIVGRGFDLDVVNGNGETCLHVAVKLQYHDGVHFLIQHRANLNLVTKADNATALYLAADLGFVNIAAMLLRSGANRQIRNRSGMTPLQRAISNNNMEMSRLLIPQTGT